MYFHNSFSSGEYFNQCDFCFGDILFWSPDFGSWSFRLSSPHRRSSDSRILWIIAEGHSLHERPAKDPLLLTHKGLFVCSYPKVAKGELSRKDGKPGADCHFNVVLQQTTVPAHSHWEEITPWFVNKSLHTHHKGRMGCSAGKDPKNHSVSCQEPPQKYSSHGLWKDRLILEIPLVLSA